MFRHALANLKGEIETWKSRISLFKSFNQVEGVKIMVETIAEPGHLAVQFLLAGVGERRVSDIVGQGQGLGQILIQPQRTGNGPGDL